MSSYPAIQAHVKGHSTNDSCGDTADIYTLQTYDGYTPILSSVSSSNSSKPHKVASLRMKLTLEDLGGEFDYMDFQRYGIVVSCNCCL